MCEVSVRERYYKKLFIWLVKRETGVNPVRTRHRILRALNLICHWGRPGRLILERLRNKPGYLPFTVQEHICSGHEELAVRNT